LDKGPDVKKEKEGEAEIGSSRPETQNAKEIRERLRELGYL